MQAPSTAYEPAQALQTAALQAAGNIWGPIPALNLRSSSVGMQDAGIGAHRLGEGTLLQPSNCLGLLPLDWQIGSDLSASELQKSPHVPACSELDSALLAEVQALIWGMHCRIALPVCQSIFTSLKNACTLHQRPLSAGLKERHEFESHNQSWYVNGSESWRSSSTSGKLDLKEIDLCSNKWKTQFDAGDDGRFCAVC